MKHIDLHKLLHIDSLIQRHSTGTPDKFAKRLELSRSVFFEYLGYMRNELDLSIKYNEYAQTYYYDGKDLCSVLDSMRCANCTKNGCVDRTTQDKDDKNTKKR